MKFDPYQIMFTHSKFAFFMVNLTLGSTTFTASDRWLFAWIYYEIGISRSFILSSNVCAELGQMVTWHSFAQRTDRENDRKFTKNSKVK